MNEWLKPFRKDVKDWQCCDVSKKILLLQFLSCSSQEIKIWEIKILAMALFFLTYTVFFLSPSAACHVGFFCLSSLSWFILFCLSLFVPLEYCPPQNFTSGLVLRFALYICCRQTNRFVGYIKAFCLCSRRGFGATLLFILYAELLFAGEIGSTYASIRQSHCKGCEQIKCICSQAFSPHHLQNSNSS